MFILVLRVFVSNNVNNLYFMNYNYFFLFKLSTIDTEIKSFINSNSNLNKAILRRLLPKLTDGRTDNQPIKQILSAGMRRLPNERVQTKNLN